MKLLKVGRTNTKCQSTILAILTVITEKFNNVIITANFVDHSSELGSMASRDIHDQEQLHNSVQAYYSPQKVNLLK